MRRDYYAVLGVAATAPPREIRQAYRRLARQYSPDVNFWDTTARTLFEEIAEAYRILSDSDARTLYDRFGARPDALAAGRRGDDVHVAVELGFSDVVRGTTVELAVARVSPCAVCDAGRPGVPAARPGRAATRRRRPGRSLRHGEGRRAGRARRAQRRARAGARAAAAAHRAWGPRAVPRGDGMTTDRGKPLYMIGVVAEMLKVHPQTLRFYEKQGLVRPRRPEGQQRLESAADGEEVA